MKYLFLILLLIPLVYAQQDFLLTKNIYYPQETFQAEIFMSDIESQDISILTPVGFPSPIGINLNKISNNHYFVSFNIPEIVPGMYTIKIKQFEEQFEIKPKKTRVFSINPALVKYTSQDKSIKKITITNHNTQSEIINIVSSDSTVQPSVNSLILPFKSSKSFFIKLGTAQTKNSLATLSISDHYKIPIWFIKDDEIIPFLEKRIEEISEEQPQETEDLQFYIKSEKQNINLNYLTKEIEESTPITGSIFFKSNLNESLTDLKLSLSGNLQDIVKLDFIELELLVPNEEKRLDIVINEDRILLEDEYTGDLVIISGEKSFKFSMNFNVVEIAEEPESLTLEELIEEEFVFEEDFEEEIPEEKPKSKTKWAYLFVVIIIVIVFAYISLRKPKAKKQSFKQFVGKIKK